MAVLAWTCYEDRFFTGGRCPLTEAAQEFVTEYVPVGEDGMLVARYHAIDASGLHVRFKGANMLLEPDADLPGSWRAFWSEFFADFDTLYTTNAAAVIVAFLHWYADRRAADGLERVNRGELGFRQLLEQQPDLQDHPDLQRAITERVARGDLPPEKRGRKRQNDPGLTELFHWVAWHVTRDGMSLDRACETAVRENPEHIPSNWNRDEAARSLRLTVDRLGRMPDFSPADSRG